MRNLAEKIIRMKKTAYFISIILLTFISCNKDTGFTLKGKIEGLKSDTLLVYYQLPEYKLDTIYTQNGQFEYKIDPDTFTIFSLFFDSLNYYPIYVNKGDNVKISGKTDSLIVNGKGENEILRQALISLYNSTPDSISIKLDSIIKSNVYSFTSLYLIDKYYVQDSLPDYSKIKDMINGLSGAIRDTPYMMDLQTKIEKLTQYQNNQGIYTLQSKKRNGEKFNLSNIKNKYILIDIWASWDKKSIEAQDSLVTVLKALKKKKFQIVSLSLDMDKDAWLKASDRDTTQWIQICDFTGWNNKIVKEQSIHTLPTNLLLDPYKRIIAKNIRGQELIDKVKELIKQDEEKEKARKKADKERKKRKKIG